VPPFVSTAATPGRIKLMEAFRIRLKSDVAGFDLHPCLKTNYRLFFYGILVPNHFLLQRFIFNYLKI